MSDSDQHPPNDDNEQPERGDPGKLFDDPAHRRSESRMVRRAIKGGWIKPSSRWNTRVPKKELIEKITTQGDVTIVDLSELAALELLSSRDLRHKAEGLRLGAVMEKMNQTDERDAIKHGSDPTRPQPVERTPDQVIDDMDNSIPFVPDKEAQ